MRQRRAVLVGTGVALVGVLMTATMALGTGKHEITTPITIKVEAIGGPEPSCKSIRQEHLVR